MPKKNFKRFQISVLEHVSLFNNEFKKLLVEDFKDLHIHENPIMRLAMINFHKSRPAKHSIFIITLLTLDMDNDVSIAAVYELVNIINRDEYYLLEYVKNSKSFNKNKEDMLNKCLSVKKSP